MPKPNPLSQQCHDIKLTVHFAVEEQSIIFGPDCSNLNFKNSQQFNYIIKNSKNKKITKHYGNINNQYNFGEV